MKNIILLIILSLLPLTGKASLSLPECSHIVEEPLKQILKGDFDVPQTRSVYNRFLVAYQKEQLIQILSDDFGVLQVDIFNDLNMQVYSRSFNTSELTEFYIDLSQYRNGRYYIQISNSNGSSLYGYFMLEDAL